MRVTVLGGGGLLGQQLVPLLRETGHEVTTVSRSSEPKVDIETGEGLVKAVEDADLVVHASGSAAGLVSALSVAGMEATIVDVSWYGSATVSLPLGEAFHSRRLTVKSSQVSHVPPDRAPRWSHQRRAKLAVQLLADDALDLLITGESPFDELPEVMARLSRAPAGVLCHRIRYATRSVDP